MCEKQTTILIVEDDEVDVEVITRGLKKRQLKFDVHTATDGEKALDYLRNGLTLEQRSRLILLLDLNMPRMNGHEFLNAVRGDEDLRRAIVFVLTTSSLETDRSRAYEKNVAGYFVKSRLDGLLDLLGTYAEHVKFPLLSAAQ